MSLDFKPEKPDWAVEFASQLAAVFDGLVSFYECEQQGLPTEIQQRNEDLADLYQMLSRSVRVAAWEAERKTREVTD